MSDARVLANTSAFNISQVADEKGKGDVVGEQDNFACARVSSGFAVSPGLPQTSRENESRI